MSVSTKKVAKLDDHKIADAQPAPEPDETGNEQLLDELQPGTVLMHGQYTITKFLNNGGFGITYLAKDSLDRDVVIKECFPSSFCRRTNSIVRARSRAHQSELSSIIRLFVQEARSLSNLEHPNIVGVHQVFEDNDTAYMAIDYVDGKDLLDLIDEDASALSPENLISITKKLLGAIGFVHSHDMLHRDISPDNILVNSDGEPILIDFGAAREHASNTNRAMSALRVVKDGYSPQEFYISGGEQGPWSDLYSFAASLYHVISGAPPINGQSRLAAIAEQTDDPYKPLAGNFEDYPPSFLEAIDKALNVMPNQRMRSAEEWIKALDAPESTTEIVSRLIKDEQTTDKGQEQTDAVENTQQPATQPRRGRARLLAGGSAVVLLAALGYVGFQSMADDTPEVALVTEPAESGETVQENSDVQAVPLLESADALPEERSAGNTDVENEAAARATDEPGPEPEDPDVAPQAAGESTAQAVPDEAEDIPAETPVVSAPADADAPEVAPTPDPEIATANATDTETQGAEGPSSGAAAAPANAEVPEVEAEIVAVAETPEQGDDLAAKTDSADATAAAVSEPAAEVPSGPENPVRLAVWDVLMPFESSLEQVRNSHTVLVDKVADGANLTLSGTWIAEGTVIYTVNGKTIDGESSLEALILNDMVTDPDGYTRASVRFKEADSKRFDRGLLAVPVVRNIWLTDGSLLQVGMQDGAWVTKVADIGDRSAGSFEVGDLLIEENVTKQTIRAPDDVERILAKLVKMQQDTAQFTVMRAGEKIAAGLSLAKSH